MTRKEQESTVVRGQIAHCINNPFSHPDQSLEFIEDGFLLIEDGKISCVGNYAQREKSEKKANVLDFSEKFIVPGFVDTHVHFAQLDVIGSHGKDLIDWLNTHTFPAETELADPEIAKSLAARFVSELLKNGTTTAAIFCTTHSGSVDAIFEEARTRSLNCIAGKVLMDRNAPSALLDSAQTGYDQSKALIEKWHGRDRLSYAITPRFAPTSTEEQLQLAGTLWKEYPGTLVQSHVSEQVSEVEWVKKLFPSCKSYLDVYERAGLLGRGSVYGHGIHLTDSEIDLCAQSETAIAHCPTSNLFLGSGLLDVIGLAKRDVPVRVGLGTDVGGGTSLSMLRTMDECYKVSALRGNPLTPGEILYLSTLGAAEALGKGSQVGTFKPGADADFVVIDPSAIPLLKKKMDRSNSLEEQLFALIVLGDDRAIERTFCAGSQAYARELGYV